MNSISNDEDDYLKALIERSRDLSLDLAAARERELESRFQGTTLRVKLRQFLIRGLKKVPKLYRIALLLKQKF